MQAEIDSGRHIIGTVVGSGITAKLAAKAGADILLVLSAGKYRIMGRSSFSSYFCFGNNNEQVMELGRREIFPIVRNVPLLFGLMATDPTIDLYEYLKKIRAVGFADINCELTIFVSRYSFMTFQFLRKKQVAMNFRLQREKSARIFLRIS